MVEPDKRGTPHVSRPSTWLTGRTPCCAGTPSPYPVGAPAKRPSGCNRGCSGWIARGFRR